MTSAINSVNVTAGGIEVEVIDSVPGSYGNLTIIFYNSSLVNPLLVDFSGAQFDLYMSKNGYSNLTSDDVLYASGFMVSDLNLPFGGQTYQISNARLLGGEGMFDLGYIDQGGTIYKVLTGPIPYFINNEYKYVKIYDGSLILIAAAGIININTSSLMASAELSPSFGPGGVPVELSVSGLRPEAEYAISYADSAIGEPMIGSAFSDSEGNLSYSWVVVDLGLDYNSVPSVDVGISIHDVSYDMLSAYVEYQEHARIFELVKGSTTCANSGNDTCLVQAEVSQDLRVVGSYFNPSYSVIFSIGGAYVASAFPALNGSFDTTFTVPELSEGIHSVVAKNGGESYVFRIEIPSSLSLTPEIGIDGVVVSFVGHGLPEGNAFIYWFNLGDSGMWHNVANSTVGPDGTLQSNASWVLSNIFGSPNNVAVTSNYFGETAGTILPIAQAKFNEMVLIIPDNFTSIQDAINYAADGYTIFVRDGEYTCTIAVDRAVSLISEHGPQNCAIVGTASTATVMISASGAELNGFNISSTSSDSHGVSLEFVQDCLITNNVIIDQRYGVHLWDSDNNFLVNNTLVANRLGAFMIEQYSDGNLLMANNISDNEIYGIYLAYSSNNLIIDNILSGNHDDGIRVYYSSNNNTMIGNDISGGNEGISVGQYSPSSDAYIYNCSIRDSHYGIYVAGSDGVIINYCNITGNTQYGVYNNESDPFYIVNATCCYWGSSNGPGREGPGDGDAVAPNVIFDPWLEYSPSSFNVTLAQFPYPMVDGNGSLNFTMVVPSSSPHGPCGPAHTMDVMSAVNLAVILGQQSNSSAYSEYVTMDDYITYYDSSSVSFTALTGRNLIIMGGPGVNEVTYYYNSLKDWVNGYGPYYFAMPVTVMKYGNGTDYLQVWSSNYTYSIEYNGTAISADYGLLQLYYDGALGRYVTIIYGLGGEGTKAASTVLANIESYNINGTAAVVKYYDSNADGYLDTIEIAEVV